MKDHGTSWFIDHQWGLLAFLIIVVTLGFLITQTLFTDELDLWIDGVELKKDNESLHYFVRLRSTHSLPDTAILRSIYEDGSFEDIPWDLRQTRHTIDFRSLKRLESLLLTLPPDVTEMNSHNNQLACNVWAQRIPLVSSYSVPETDYLVDDQGRFWFVAAGRNTEDAQMTIFLTVLDATGKRLIDRLPLSAPDQSSRYPVLRALDGRLHILWCGYGTETQPHHLYQTSFDLLSANLAPSPVQEIIHPTDSLLRPVMVHNNPTDPLLLVHTEHDGRTGFHLYRLQETGIADVGPIVEENLPVSYDGSIMKDIIFLTDGDGTYQLIWNEQQDFANLYFLKLRETGQTLFPRVHLSKNFSNPRISGLQAVPLQKKNYLFWSYTSERMSSLYHLCYMITDEMGQIQQDMTILRGPSTAPLRDITACSDAQGYINLVWLDSKVINERATSDLVFQKLTPDMRTLIPAYPITHNLTTELEPVLKQFAGGRYLTWREFDQGEYHLYLTHNNPALSDPKAADSWNRTLSGLGKIAWAALTSLGLQIFFVFPLNFLAMIVFFACIALFAMNKLRNQNLTWATIIGSLLLAKFASFHSLLGQITQLDLLTLADCYKVSIVTLGITLGIYAVIHGLWKHEKAGIEVRSLYIAGWFLLDSFALLFVDQMMLLG